MQELTYPDLFPKEEAGAAAAPVPAPPPAAPRMADVSQLGGKGKLFAIASTDHSFGIHGDYFGAGIKGGKGLEHTQYKSFEYNIAARAGDKYRSGEEARSAAPGTRLVGTVDPSS